MAEPNETEPASKGRKFWRYMNERETAPYPKWEPKSPSQLGDNRPPLERIAQDVALIRAGVVFIALVVAVGVVAGLIAAFSGS